MIEAPNVSFLLILAIFFATMWLLNRMLFAPISKILAEREHEASEAAQSFAQARAGFDEAAARIESELAAARREALKIREQRRAEGIASRQEALAGARKGASERLAAALTEVEKASADASREMPQRVAELARELAGRVLGRGLAA